MNPIEETKKILEQATELMRSMPGQEQWLSRLAELQARLSQPCVLAIAGRVKAGKSSFLNALIGQDLAKVGELETTATINRFCYGEPEDPERPVTVVWEGGMETQETLAFMDSLQGHDPETLRKAGNISYLEFRLRNELLREITLVDTPGTDALVSEHEEVTQDFFNLRAKHREQSTRLTGQADAVIYLVGAVATQTAHTFLADFKDTSSGATALNALGVMSKVDIDATLIQKRKEQAAYVANSLREQLNTVVPVSAGLYMAVRDHRHEMGYWQQRLKTIPPKAFAYLMRQESMYLTERQDVMDALYKDTGATPLSLDERKQLRGNLFWSLFRTIATTLYDTANLEEALKQLDDIANMDEVRQTIHEQFFNRSKVLRCYSVLSELHTICDHLRRNVFAKMRDRNRQLQQWTQFVEANTRRESAQVAGQLLDFLKQQNLSNDTISNLEKRFRNELLVPLENVMFDLEQFDADYRMLKQLQTTREAWPENEYEELCQLFGLYGQRAVPEGCRPYERQRYWRARASRLADKRMRAIAEYAVDVYGEI